MSDLVERLRKPVAYGPVGAQKARIEAADEIERLLCENGVLWDTLKHIASMDSEKYILGNATSLAKFAVESRDARASEQHNNLTDVEHNNLKMVADSASEGLAPDEQRPTCTHGRPKDDYCRICESMNRA